MKKVLFVCGSKCGDMVSSYAIFDGELRAWGVEIDGDGSKAVARGIIRLQQVLLACDATYDVHLISNYGNIDSNITQAVTRLSRKASKGNKLTHGPGDLWLEVAENCGVIKSNGTSLRFGTATRPDEMKLQKSAKFAAARFAERYSTEALEGRRVEGGDVDSIFV